MGQTVLLFDAGVGDVGGSLAIDRLLAGLRGWPLPAALFLTHGHADHSGGSAAIRQKGAVVHAGAQTAAWMAVADEPALSLDVARASGIYPEGYVLPPCKTDCILHDGQSVEIAGARITAIATPGHSADHMSYLVERGETRVLIGGDAIFTGGRVILQDTWDCSVSDTCASIRRLASLSPTAILPGHGPIMVGRKAAEALAQASERVARLLPPRLFL